MTSHAACSPTWAPLTFACRARVVVYPVVAVFVVTLLFQPTSATASSPACALLAVVPVEAAVPVAAALARTSTPVTAMPLTSTTVRVITELAAAVPPTVTVTDCAVERLAAPTTYQISSSAWPWATATAGVQVWCAESVTLVTGAGALTLRSRIVATRRSPAAVAAVGVADNVAPALGLAAPNDCTTGEPALTDASRHSGVMAASVTASTRTLRPTRRAPDRRRRRLARCLIDPPNRVPDLTARRWALSRRRQPSPSATSTGVARSPPAPARDRGRCSWLDGPSGADCPMRWR